MRLLAAWLAIYIAAWSTSTRAQTKTEIQMLNTPGVPSRSGSPTTVINTSTTNSTMTKDQPTKITRGSMILSTTSQTSISRQWYLNEEKHQPGFQATSDRDYLNRLLDSSVKDSEKQLCNLAFLKTHKTGSTTLSSLLYRYGVRHGRKVARYDNKRKHIGKPLPIDEAFSKILETCGGRVDIMHYHIGTSSSLGSTWQDVERYYRSIMRDPDHINFVTIVREPREHFLSYYYYFISHRLGNKSIIDYMDNIEYDAKYLSDLTNPFAGEVGVHDIEDLVFFTNNVLPKMKLVLLTERFDEGLMVLRILMRWRLIDMTYVSLNRTKLSSRQQSSKTSGRPRFEELPKQTQEKIDNLTRLDKALYDAGRREFEKVLTPLAQDVAKDLAIFHQMQYVLAKYLASNSSSPANVMYSYEDLYHAFPAAEPF